jgi:hypothetical protein
MAFEYLGSGSLDLFNTIFREILKISPTLLYKYVTLQDQVLYLILIPSVIVLFFIWTFGYWIVGDAHRGIRLLISAIAYIYIVYSGWYGSFIIPIILAWFPIVLFSYFAFFIMTRIMHPSNVAGASKVMSAVYKKASEKRKHADALEKEIDLVNKKINQLQAMRGGTHNPRAEANLTAEIARLEQKRIALREKLDSLGG